MKTPRGAKAPLAMPDDRQVSRAIRYTYGQVMLNSVFFASTGGMFLVGFAMKLGAGDFFLGLMTTLPALFIVSQLFGAWLVERGNSRKSLTFGFGLVAPLSWGLIAAIPLLGTSWARGHLSFLKTANLPLIQLGILVAVLATVNMTQQVANAARASWVGELIPEERRGRFFGYAAMYGGSSARSSRSPRGASSTWCSPRALRLHGAFLLRRSLRPRVGHPERPAARLPAAERGEPPRRPRDRPQDALQPPLYDAGGHARALVDERHLRAVRDRIRAARRGAGVLQARSSHDGLDDRVAHLFADLGQDRRSRRLQAGDDLRLAHLGAVHACVAGDPAGRAGARAASPAVDELHRRHRRRGRKRSPSRR